MLSNHDFVLEFSDGPNITFICFEKRKQRKTALSRALERLYVRTSLINTLSQTHTRQKMTASEPYVTLSNVKFESCSVRRGKIKSEEEITMFKTR